jgi:hypothetical protein
VENRSLKSLDAYVQKNGIQKTKIPNLVKESDYVLGRPARCKAAYPVGL